MLLERAAGAVHQTDWGAAAAAWVRARRGPRVEARPTAIEDYIPEETPLFLSAFPMFVPSLSWQNDAFYI